MKKSDNRRNILSLSGGKDSAALAVYLKDKVPNLEYVFLDTGKELPETYEYLSLMEQILGIEITKIKPTKDFDFWLNIFRGCLPSPQNRWCTRKLKINPYEKHIGNDKAYSYIGLRADEDRMGYISHKNNIIPLYPFIEDSIIKKDVINILNDIGLGLPKYYEWRSRSGCFFCFFQQRNEWIRLYENHPDLFKKASEYETNHSDGRIYTWVEGNTLENLLKNKKEILERSDNNPVKNKPDNTLANRMSGLGFNFSSNNILKNKNEEEKDKPCLQCIL